MKLEVTGSIQRIKMTCVVDIRMNNSGSQIKIKRINFRPRERRGLLLKTVINQAGSEKVAHPARLCRHAKPEPAIHQDSEP